MSEVLPAPSSASTPTTYVVPHVSEATVYDVEEVWPTFTRPLYTLYQPLPSDVGFVQERTASGSRPTYTLYRSTDTLSDDEPQETSMVDTDASLILTELGSVGGLRSGHGPVVIVNGVLADLLPAASAASTLNEYWVLQFRRVNA
jgi:hypothetical protein